MKPQITFTAEPEINNAVAVNDKGAEAEEKEPTALEKFWKAVRDNPSDFTGWTYLLQFVEQQVGHVVAGYLPRVRERECFCGVCQSVRL